MRGWKTVACVAAMVVSGGGGFAGGPAAQGQARTPRATEPSTRVFQYVGGGGWIGVSVRDITDEDVAKMKLPAASGALIEDVTRDSPAATAGFKTGDVIVEFDGERVRSTRHLTRLVQDTPSGRKVQASVMRDGQRVPLSVEPQASGRNGYSGDFDNLPELARRWMMPAPPAPPAPPAGPMAPMAPRPPIPPAPPSPPAMRDFFEFDGFLGRGNLRLGVAVTDLEPQLAEYFAVKDGVLVTSVTSGSTAAKAGVKAGDVITSLNGATVSSPADLRQRAAALKNGDELSIGIVRDRKTMTLAGKVEGVSERRRTTAIL